MGIQVNFLQAVARYQDAIFRLAYSYTKSQFDADDVTQNVLLKLYQSKQNFESEAHLKNWLMRVTVNQCKNLFRAPWRETVEHSGETESILHQENKPFYP